MPTCPVCHGQYAEADLLGSGRKKNNTPEAPDTLPGKVRLCPRCETDIYSWRPHIAAIRPLTERPYPLIVPLLSIVQGALTGWQPHLIGVILAVIISAIVFFSLANHAKTFRISKWARPFNDNPGPSIETVELGSFLVGLGLGLVAIVLMVYWTLPPAESNFLEQLFTSLIYSFAFTCLTLAFTLMLVNGQIRELDHIMPQPVFTNSDRLLKIVLKSAREQLNLQDAPTIENIERTQDAGLRAILSLKRKVTTTERKGEAKVSIKRQADELEASRTEEAKITEQDEKVSIARWEIKADMWGRIRSIDLSDWWSFVET